MARHGPFRGDAGLCPVVETGSFTRAAQTLQISRTTATQLVQQLEAHLRLRLLNRTTRRVSVTADGAAYYRASPACWPSWKKWRAGWATRPPSRAGGCAWMCRAHARLVAGRCRTSRRATRRSSWTSA